MSRLSLILGFIVLAGVSCLNACKQRNAAPKSRAASAGDDAAATGELSPESRSMIEAMIKGVGRYADERRWEIVRGLFAETVVLDYGQPETVSPSEIIRRWRPLLSSFDSTRHEIENIEISRDGSRVLAHSTFTATHVMSGAAGGDTFVLKGKYEHEFVARNNTWRISRMKMIPGDSSGNKNLIDLAQAKGKADPKLNHDTFEVRKVQFDSGNDALAGDLFLPVKRDGRLPAVVIVGSWTSVKEQMSTLYAQRFASAGVAALVFDFRGFGESAGLPIGYESPTRKIADIRAAIRFLRTVGDVDPQRIFGTGICAGAGYMAHAVAAEGRNVSGLLLVAPWLHDESIVRGLYGAQTGYEGADGYQARLAAGQAAKKKFDQDGTVDFVLAASATDARAAMYGPVDYYLNASRGAVPLWRNTFATMSWSEWLTFDGIAAADRIQVPTLVVHSEAAAIPQGVHRFEGRLKGKKTVEWLQGSQFDFYDQPALQEQVMSFAVPFVSRQ